MLPRWTMSEWCVALRREKEEEEVEVEDKERVGERRRGVFRIL